MTFTELIDSFQSTSSSKATPVPTKTEAAIPRPEIFAYDNPFERLEQRLASSNKSAAGISIAKKPSVSEPSAEPPVTKKPRERQASSSGPASESGTPKKEKKVKPSKDSRVDGSSTPSRNAVDKIQILKKEEPSEGSMKACGLS